MQVRPLESIAQLILVAHIATLKVYLTTAYYATDDSY